VGPRTSVEFLEIFAPAGIQTQDFPARSPLSILTELCTASYNAAFSSPNPLHSNFQQSPYRPYYSRSTHNIPTFSSHPTGHITLGQLTKFHLETQLYWQTNLLVCQYSCVDSAQDAQCDATYPDTGVPRTYDRLGSRPLL
jgi:hypothetical protein